MRRTVIVGSSVGGVRTAQALRRAEYDGDVVLLGEETALPYDKPPLSKDVLAGTQPAEAIGLLGERAAAEAGIELRLGRRAARLDVAASTVHLDDGTDLGYDDLVVATGATPRPSPWGQPNGVHLLRTAADSAALHADLVTGGHLVVIGAGFIGAEVASTARALGLEVSIVDTVAVPMAGLFGEQVGERFAALHRDHGVRTRFGVGVAGIDGARGALRVRLSDGSNLTASTVVVGIGVTPNDGWLADSGLSTDDGLVCDEHCRALGQSNVYGVGDVLRWWHGRHAERVRIEHWTNAVEGATVVAHNITHPDEPRAFAPVEYVWSNQYGRKIQFVGRTGGATPEFFGDPDAGRFAALYPAERTVAGLVSVNWPKAMLTARRAIATGTALADVRAQLSELS